MSCMCHPAKTWIFMLIALAIFGFWYLSAKGQLPMKRFVASHAVKNLFPSSPDELAARGKHACEQAEYALQQLLSVPASQRTFENTIAFFDAMTTEFWEVASVAYLLQNVSPDTEMRAAANATLMGLQNKAVDLFSNNRDVYQAVCDYLNNHGTIEQLNEEERRYIGEMVRDFEKGGINLPEVQQERIRQLQKELAQLSEDFKLNVNSDMRTIAVTREALQGLDDSFIEQLNRDDAGNYILGIDYPTYFKVMEQCSITSTRQALWLQFNNRAYPKNEPILKKIIALRDELAHILGFESYAHLNIDGEMAKTPERVHLFLQELICRSNDKLSREMSHLKNNLPEGVILTPEGKFYRWDLTYVMHQYQKNCLNLDGEKVREYFEVQRTIEQVLDIYGTFLDVDFRQEPLEGLWHPDVRYVVAYNKEGQLLGHLLLDLHPRPYKYGHACEQTIAPALKHKNGSYTPPVIVVIANFPYATAEKPALLDHSEVKTFFHEFGHAMHALFGATEMAGFAGTHVKKDFVEMPSQMLEEWMYDPAMLKKVGAHYKTGEPLDDQIIATLIAVKEYGRGYWVQRQAWCSLLALEYFAPGAHKEVNALQKSLTEKLFGDYLKAEEEDHFEAAFSHLLGYGACYYGYLWSKVFALDMFNYVQQRGLLNPEVGRHYIDTVIGKGGSCDPDDMLVNFLGRQPNSDAFWRDCGL